MTEDVLVQDVINTLGHLDEQIVMDLHPPELVLDATTSRDRKPVFAIVTAKRKTPEMFNILRVTTNNGSFARHEIGPGDVVHYFIKRDKEDERWGTVGAAELPVAQRIDDNTLALAVVFPEPITFPARMEIWRRSSELSHGIMRAVEQFISSGRSSLGRLPRRGSEKYTSALGWEPLPDSSALEHLVERLNQWLQEAETEDAWKRDPLVESLPPQLAQFATPERLEKDAFDYYDVRLIQEAIWLRDIARWAKNDAHEALDVARNLFDWTVRNVQLETREALGGRYHRPWQTLLFGRGTAEERAWIFTLLARQEGLDVVMLGIADSASRDNVRPWAPALFHGGKLYVFDAELGLPLPDSTGEGVATLADLANDDVLLRSLDWDAARPYPITAGELSRVVALVEASPLALSQRAELLESQFSGAMKIALTAHPSRLAARISGEKGVGGVRLWQLPYQTMRRQMTMDETARRLEAEIVHRFAFQPLLYKARVLHFQGKFDYRMIEKLYGEVMANKYEAEKGKDLKDEIRQYASARYFYTRSRPPDYALESTRLHPLQREVLRKTKMSASYWLGLLSYDDGDFAVAEDFFKRFTLEAHPDGPWTPGAKYNLARTYEQQGETGKAVALLEATKSTPQAHGNALRARRLQAK